MESSSPYKKSPFVKICRGFFNALILLMHPRTFSGAAILLLSLLVAGLNLLALRYFLYWRTWWYDIPMHFLGGLICAAIVLWFVAYEVPPGLRSKVNRLALTVIATLIIGILWEIFEYKTGITKGEIGYWQDTIHDIGMDLAGGLAAYLLLKDHGR